MSDSIWQIHSQIMKSNNKNHGKYNIARVILTSIQWNLNNPIIISIKQSSNLQIKQSSIFLLL